MVTIYPSRRSPIGLPDRTGAPLVHFESFADGRGWNASFREPTRQRVARTLDEVIPLLRDAEATAKAGKWVALVLSYEAAPAFDTCLEVKPPSHFPLAWMAVFEESSPLDLNSIPESSFRISELDPHISKAQYQQTIHSIRKYIEEGDTYQVNFTFPMHGHADGDSLAGFRAIAESQGAAYSAYLDIGSHKILSFSPELFVECRGDRVTTQPMKGTLGRGRWLEEDCERIEQLRASSKDRAENVMIVDLLRSDLGKVAEFGSVEVSNLFAVERLSRVLQMTSTVSAVRKPDVDLVAVMRALFPCGSVTGAPKSRTMAIINELEREPRGIYTGTIGLLSPGGDAVFNVAIRTLIVDAESGAATFNVGGGITWDSTPEGEYEECALKAQFLSEPWPTFELLETMELNEGKYSLLARHLGRARSSALYFGFRWNEARITEALEEVRESHMGGRWRVRLTVARGGEPNVEVRRLNRGQDKPLAVKFALTPVDDLDPLLFHKTTARALYSTALEQCQPCDDVILWNRRGEVTESTIANVVVFSGGKYWTPPREAGLLAGTLRDELISQGKLFERTITKTELTENSSFVLINSVRGWMPAELSSAREPVSDVAHPRSGIDRLSSRVPATGYVEHRNHDEEHRVE